MAEIRRKVTPTAAGKSATTPAARRGAVAPKVDNLTLPTQKSKPVTDLGAYTWLIYGDKKIGKTSLTAQFPETLLLSFEPGAKALQVYQRDVPTWDHFIEYVNLIIEGDHDFQTVAIDTGSIAYDRALEYACRVHGFQHPGGQNDFGQSWAKVKGEFQKPFGKLFGTGCGVIITAHEREKKIETRSGTEYDVICPLLTGQAEEYMAGVIDNIGYYYYVGKKRFLRIRGDELVVAGTRCEGRFLTPSGEQVVNIPMGNSAAEAYKNLVTAFNNKQKETYADLGKVR